MTSALIALLLLSGALNERHSMVKNDRNEQFLEDPSSIQRSGQLLRGQWQRPKPPHHTRIPRVGSSLLESTRLRCSNSQSSLELASP